MRAWAITATLLLILTNILWFGIAHNLQHLYTELDQEYNQLADKCGR